MLIGALFPRRCPICDKAIREEEYICPGCAVRIRPIQWEKCIKCGKSIPDGGNCVCYDCSRKIHYYDRGFAIFEYGDVKQSLYRFKYNGRAEYAAFYALAAVKEYGRILRGLKLDAIIPVPIHRKRLSQRGYNQAEELGRELAKRINVPCISDYVIRQKATKPLKLLDEEERINNLKKAFITRSNGVKLKSVIVVDDIYTTGATVDSIAEVLRGDGVEKIYYLTVAIGKGL